VIETMSFELCTEIECKNESLNVRAASKHWKYYTM